MELTVDFNQLELKFARIVRIPKYFLHLQHH